MIDEFYLMRLSIFGHLFLSIVIILVFICCLLRKYARGLRLYDLAVVFLNKNLRTRRGYPSLQLKEKNLAK